MDRFLYMFYFFFQGILVFQTLFLLALYIIANKKDILFYFLFLLVSAIYFFLNAPNTFFGLNDDIIFNSSFYRYLNIPVIILANLFYILFLKSYFHGLYSSIKLKNAFRTIFFLIPILILVFYILVVLKQTTQIIFYIVNFLSFSLSIYIVVHILKKKIFKVGWVLTGMIFNMAGTLLTILMIVLDRYNIRNILTHDYPLFFMRCGILADIFFYMIAIIKKWNFQEKQLALQQIEKQLAVEKIRNQISSELHDDIGSTLSGVSMYTYMAANLIDKNEYDSAKASLTVIQKSTDEMVDKLGDLVWSVNPRQDSLKLLFERLEQFATQMCAAKNIVFSSVIPHNIIEINLPNEHRHHLYLVLKEAINNAVKYSGASKLTLNVMQTNNVLDIYIVDNGKGFDKAEIKLGNGLKNIHSRAKEILAKLVLESKAGEGTQIKLRFKI